jgi:uncharacterized protein (UPF0128 family)
MKAGMSRCWLNIPPMSYVISNLQKERKEIELFKKEFIILLKRIDKKESEENHKNLLKNFLGNS